jgi:hypothetical protein
MPTHDITSLEKKVTDLSNALAHLGTTEDLHTLLKIIKQPGWTTPAEFVLVNSIVESITAQTKSIATQRQQLLKAAEQVTTKEYAAAR